MNTHATHAYIPPKIRITQQNKWLTHLNPIDNKNVEWASMYHFQTIPDNQFSPHMQKDSTIYTNEPTTGFHIKTKPQVVSELIRAKDASVNFSQVYVDDPRGFTFALSSVNVIALVESNPTIFTNFDTHEFAYVTYNNQTLLVSTESDLYTRAYAYTNARHDEQKVDDTSLIGAVLIPKGKHSNPRMYLGQLCMYKNNNQVYKHITVDMDIDTDGNITFKKPYAPQLKCTKTPPSYIDVLPKTDETNTLYSEIMTAIKRMPIFHKINKPNTIVPVTKNALKKAFLPADVNTPSMVHEFTVNETFDQIQSKPSSGYTYAPQPNDDIIYPLNVATYNLVLHDKNGILYTGHLKFKPDIHELHTTYQKLIVENYIQSTYTKTYNPLFMYTFKKYLTTILHERTQRAKHTTLRDEELAYITKVRTAKEELDVLMQKYLKLDNIVAVIKPINSTTYETYTIDELVQNVFNMAPVTLDSGEIIYDIQACISYTYNNIVTPKLMAQI